MLFRSRVSPTKVGRRFGRDALDLARLLEGLPHRVDRIVQRLETGDIEFAFRNDRLESESKKLHRAVDRLTLGLTATLFLMAASLYGLVAEIAETGSIQLAYLRVLFGFGGVFLIVLGARIWKARDR